MKGTCTGEGRIRLRLQASEDLEQIRSNLAIAGIRTDRHQEDPQRKPVLTGEEANPKNPLDVKKSKDFAGVTVQKRSAKKAANAASANKRAAKARWV